MAAITIKDEDISSLAGKSGIGLATTKLLLNLGASVISGDINPVPIEHPNLSFVKTNVISWSDLSALFDRAIELHGRVDHAFANAGISGRTNYLDGKLDENGKLLEPTHETIDINLKSVINTATLALHHMRSQDPPGGSIVATASASSFQRFRIVDYTTAKHGVLGFIRGITPSLEQQDLPIRVNGIAPNWTVTGLVPPGMIEAIGHPTQGPEVVARSVALLMADESRAGQLIYSDQGRYWEIEDRMLQTAADIVGSEDADRIVEKVAKSKTIDFQHASKDADKGDA